MTRYDVFLRVAETGSFTRAAESLGYSQSAVSQTVKALEAELGSRLVLRGHGGVTLTADGESYLPYLRAVSAAEEELARKRRETLGLEQGVIRIGAFTSVSRTLLPKLMQEFRRDYPSVQFFLHQGEYNNIRAWILDGTVDFGFLCPDAVDGVETIPLYRDRMEAVLPPGHPLAVRETVRLSELAREPFILLDEGEFSVPMRAFAAAGLSPVPLYKVYDDYSILAMAEQGLGCSILYEAVLGGEYGRRVEVRPIAEPVERTVALAFRNREALSTAASRFLTHILRWTGAGPRPGQGFGDMEKGVGQL